VCGKKNFARTVAIALSVAKERVVRKPLARHSHEATDRGSGAERANRVVPPSSVYLESLRCGEWRSWRYWNEGSLGPRKMRRQAVTRGAVSGWQSFTNKKHEGGVMTWRAC